MKLAEYLSERGIKRTEFASAIGVSQSYVTMICAGQIWPGREIIAKIGAITDGLVTANDFVEPLTAEQAHDLRQGIG